MQKIIQTALDKAAEQVENFNKQIEDLEAKVGDVSKTAGITVSFKRVPEGMVPSLDDIQRLQTIARVPAIFCSDEFQKIIEPLLLIPPLRLALELFNIPTIPETKEKMCSGVPKGSIADTVGDAADPDVGIIPGGPADQAQQAAAKVQEAASQAQAVVQDAQKQVEGAASFLGSPKQFPTFTGAPTQAIGAMVGGKKQKSRTRKNKKSTK